MTDWVALSEMGVIRCIGYPLGLGLRDYDEKCQIRICECHLL